VEALAAAPLAGVGVLIVRAAEAREVLPDELRRRGARVEVVPAYRTLQSDEDAGAIRAMLRERSVHVVTFASSSTVRNFLEMVGPETAELLRGVVVASIGPITAQTAAEAGIASQVVPDRYTIPAFVDALLEYFRASR
jgi:uroporphyrinogen III methyltransferase/synthase